MAFILKEDAQISNGGGTLNVSVINDEATALVLGQETTYGVSLEQIKTAYSENPGLANIPDVIIATIKSIRGLGE